MNFATTENLEIAVSVVDKGGHLMGFMRTENSSFAAIAVSKRKALSACAFGLPTDVIGALVQKNLLWNGHLQALMIFFTSVAAFQ